jgi:cytoskeletal protein RodZ
MESLGAHLRRKREERGRSIDDLARETRIQAYLLTALENDDLAPLPHPAFVRGFLRNVCRALGTPNARALELYDELVSPSGDGSSNASAEAEPSRIERGRAEAERSSTFPKGLLARRSRFSPMMVAVVALIAFVVLFFAVKISGGALQEDRTPTVAWPANGAATSAWSPTSEP